MPTNNVQEFITNARAHGYSDAQINAWLEKNGYGSQAPADVQRAGAAEQATADVRTQEATANQKTAGESTISKVAGGAADVVNATLGAAQAGLEKTGIPQIVGDVVGTAGETIGTGIGAVAGLPAIIKGKTNLSGYLDRAQQTGEATRNFGSSVGQQGPLGAILGGAGRVVQGALTLPSAYATYRAAKSGNVPEALLQGSLTAASIIGMRGNRAALPGAMERRTVNPLTRSAVTSAIDEGATAATVKNEAAGYVKAAQKYAENPARDPSPFMVASKKAEEVLTNIDDELKTLGEQKKTALQMGGDRVVKGVDEVKRDFKRKLSEDMGLEFGRFKESSTLKAREQGGGSVTDADRAFLENVWKDLAELDNKNVPARVVDQKVDKLQALIYERKKTATLSPDVAALIEQTVGTLNGKLKTTLADTKFPSVNDRMSTLIGARKDFEKIAGKEGVKGEAFMRGIIGNEQKKALANELKNITGVDLVREASLAKFASDMYGMKDVSGLFEAVSRGKESLAARSIQALVQNRVAYAIGKLLGADPLTVLSQIADDAELGADLVSPAAAGTAPVVAKDMRDQAKAAKIKQREAEIMRGKGL